MSEDKHKQDILEWLTKRFKALGDLSEFLSVASPEYKNPEVYLQKLILEEPNLLLAEKRVATLEKVTSQAKGVSVNRDAIKLQKLRIDRLEALRKTDWTQLPDVPLTSDEKKTFREYRAYLREMPQKIARLQLLSYEVPNLEEYLKLKKA